MIPGQKAESGAGGVSRLAAMLGSSAVRGRGRHSSLTRWLQAHHDEFEAMLRERQPGWGDVAQALAAMGLRDGAQKPPNGERVRKAWWYARQEALARQKATSRSGQIAKPAVTQYVSDARPERVPARDMLPAGVETVQPSRPRPRLDIRPATPLSGSSTEPVSPTSPVGWSVNAAAEMGAGHTVQAGDDHLATELRRALEQMDVNKVPLPKVVS